MSPPTGGHGALRDYLRVIGAIHKCDVSRCCFLFEYRIIKMAKKYQTPPYLIFYPTSSCNLRCRHCYYWRELGKSSSEELSLGQIESLCKELGKLRILWLGGGEPLLRLDLLEVLKLFYRYNRVKILSIPTNGWLTDLIVEQIRKILAISGKRRVSVVVSLDGDQASHDSIRGEGSFARALLTIKALQGLKKEYKTLLVRINVTVSASNYSGVVRLLQQSSGCLGVPDVFNLSILRGSPADPLISPPSLADLRRLWREKISLCRENKPWWSHWLEWATFEAGLIAFSTGKRSFTCEAGRLMGVVYEDGRVSFCEFLPPLGNIRERSFADIWHSDLADQQRLSIAAKKCSCYHDCFFLVNLLSYPWLIIYFGWRRLISSLSAAPKRYILN